MLFGIHTRKKNENDVHIIVLSVADILGRFIWGTVVRILHDIHAYAAYACIKGHLEPTHLKSSPVFTFSTKSLGQDSPSIHLFSRIIGSRFTTAKINLGEDSLS